MPILIKEGNGGLSAHLLENVLRNYICCINWFPLVDPTN